MEIKLTVDGKNLLLRTLAGDAEIQFRSILLGSGEDAGEGASGLSALQLEVQISKCAVGDDFATITGVFNNSAVEAPFRETELGVTAADPEDGEKTILYAYGHVSEADADLINKSNDEIQETQIDVLAYIGNAENVSASIASSLVYVPMDDFKGHVENKDNPHGVTAEQVGLGDVPNVATNDQTPTYTMPSAPVAMTSGEKLSVAMGKAARAVASLITHLRNRGNPHGVTAEQVGLGDVPNVATNDQTPTYEVPSALSGLKSGEKLSDAMGKLALAVKSLGNHLTDMTHHVMDTDRKTWNGKADGTHEHSADDITSGVLGVWNGGTGVNNYYSLAQNLTDCLALPYIGTYIGDGTKKRKIKLKHPICAVIVVDEKGRMGDYGGVVSAFSDIQIVAGCTSITHKSEWNDSHTALMIENDGFYVNYSSNSGGARTNTNGVRYTYIAFSPGTTGVSDFWDKEDET